MLNTIRRDPLSRAFTLIEILIVVVILGILAAIVLPSLGTASKQSRESVLRDELRFIRTQLSLYKASHMSAPGIDASGAASEATLVAQLTNYTDFFGNTSAIADTTHTFAPYLSVMPNNPFIADGDSITLVPDGTPIESAVDGSTAWLYKPETLEFCANSTEYGPGGKNW